MRPLLTNGALLLAIATLHGGAAHAEGVYRWQDAQGNTVFSQRPPPGREAELVKPRGGKSTDTSGKQLEAARKQFAPPAPKEEAAAKTPTPEEQAKLAAACQQARDALKLLQENNRPRYVDESGQTAFMGDAVKAERTADAQKKITDYCR